MTKLIVNSGSTLKKAQTELKLAFESEHYVTVTIKAGKRSLDQNALSHHWHKELSEQGDMLPEEYHAECKYYQGMTILAETDEEYVAVIRKAFRPLTHEERMIAMKKIQVTSLFNRDQMTRYLSQIKLKYEPEGFVLTNSDDY